MFVSKIAMREMTEQQVYTELDNRTKTKFDKFDDMAGKCIQGLDKVSEKANVLIDIAQFANNSELNNILQALKFFKV